MCWCFPFGLSNTKKRKSTSSPDKKRREKPVVETLHGDGLPVVAEVREKRRSSETTQKRRSREAVTTRSPRREREEPRSRQTYQYQYADAYKSREQYRPSLNVQVPNMWHRTVDPEDASSSQEMLLNPRPHRSPHQRQRHPKRTSQTTLRGRGAKRDPPKGSKSKGKSRQTSSRQSWSFFAPSPPKTPSRRSTRHYEPLDSSPRSHRSPRHHHHTSSPSTYTPLDPPESSSSSSSRPHHRSRHPHRQPPSRHARSRTPNTAARRTPDRRFAVLAATNQALEDLRREAFSQPSPPPRRERVQRYQGVQVPTHQIPFNWDCVSSGQGSAGEARRRGGRGRW
ncbi:hypothetical protein EJ04DRAFT_193245 [Polyplosphaeria fusca]|uniref:Uncharacterized protein n=1 Tax=Polyplosphaeria fusca TaxID=682080 RepID=A0A9P4V2G4_9PLEO|nr:hypothetical protein EJ04DRAFT_193245 [Polyplosphaeria fusca]